jgi:hypothetical protein
MGNPSGFGYKGGVTTCTARSERSHHETKPQCPHSGNLLRIMGMLITLVTHPFESTKTISRRVSLNGVGKNDEDSEGGWAYTCSQMLGRKVRLGHPVSIRETERRAS